MYYNNKKKRLFKNEKVLSGHCEGQSLEESQKLIDYGLYIDGFLDMTVNKLCAMADRFDAKDYVDVY